MIIECNFFYDNEKLEITDVPTPGFFDSESILFTYKSIEKPDRTVIIFKYMKESAQIDIKFKDLLKMLKPDSLPKQLKPLVPNYNTL